MNPSSLKKWFKNQKRSLPWRDDPSPYRVWVSEVMLQQTQVAVVIPYFERWMEQFPTIKDLAKAPIEQVIKAWEGLGYYSRARNLHTGAQFILEHFDGHLPSDTASLQLIKGLGPYTIAAIQSFAFNMKAAPVDGNVMRVLSRHELFEEDLSKPKNVKTLFSIANDLLPDEEPWVFGEALIELGATVCTKKPKCSSCPIQSSCQAYVHQKMDTLPYKSKKLKSEKLYRDVVVVQAQGHLLISKESENKVMKDLYQFPFFERKGKRSSKKKVQEQLESLLDQSAIHVATLPLTTHSFTRFSVELTPYVFEIDAIPIIDQHEWVKIDEIHEKPFSSGHRRVMLQVKDACCNEQRNPTR